MMAAVVRKHVSVSEFEDESDHTDFEGENQADKSDDGEEAEDECGEEPDEEDDGNANAGWAEAMAKILGKTTPKTKNSSSIILKNRDLEKEKERDRREQLEKRNQVDRRQAWEMMCREKPDMVKDRETERALQRIATRGVVQLFNAVRKHQKTMDDKVKEVGGSERKKAKILSSVSKRDFINVLRRTEGSTGSTASPEKEDAAEEKPAWSVLRDDFMMGATMKDWDKDSEGEEADAHRVTGGP